MGVSDGVIDFLILSWALTLRLWGGVNCVEGSAWYDPSLGTSTGV